MTHTWFSAVQELTLTLVRFPSVTNSRGEIAFATYLQSVLAAHPYFQAHPAHVWTEQASEDPLGRRNVFALVRGEGSETVLLSGHFDVVNVDNYGPLAPFAYDPPTLLPRLIEVLAADQHDPANQLALADLQSGDYMPGRGALDMKSGLAAGIAVLFEWASQPERVGNILLVASPDEEETSQGMRGAAQALPRIYEEWGLDPLAAINLDAVSDRGDGTAGRAVYLGSTGKLLPTVLLVGKETHAGFPFDGLNPNLMAAEVTRRLEGNIALCDILEGQLTAPPVNLKQADWKQYYDVTTPTTAWCTYNVLSCTRSPAMVLTMFCEIVQAALDAAAVSHADQARQYGERTGQTLASASWQPKVMTFAQLRQYALAQGGATVEQNLHTLLHQLTGDQSVDLPEFSRRVTTALWEWSGLAGPAAVIGFGSIYYPPVVVGRTTPKHSRLRTVATRQALRLAQTTDSSIRVKPFYPAIADISFLGATDTPDNIAAMADNTPPFGSRIQFDYLAAQAPNVPCINIGPWGRDYHQCIERVNMPYSFEVLPELIWRIVTDLLATEHAE